MDSIVQIRQLTERRATRLVRNDRELQQVILEALGRLQQQLQGETPAVRDLWDRHEKNLWRPVDDNDLSDYLRRHLKNDLSASGIVSLREVEIRRGNSVKGQRTDLYVAATIQGQLPDSYDSVPVIVEVKGCWHAELQTAMETQLRDRYLRDNDCECGVFVVGWFESASWGSGDRRREKVPDWTLANACHQFEAQSQRLSDDSCSMKSYVIDASLR